MKGRAIAAALILMLASGILPSAGEAQTPGGFAFDRYHDYSEIKAELERISDAYPDITELAVLGQTWEGRDIMALRVTDDPQEEDLSEPDVLIMGAHHANELPSAEVPLYILESLTGNYTTDWNVRELVDSRDIWFVPLVNPDGREYALNNDMSWRKNRRPIDIEGDGTIDGTGADLNRNYGHLWGELPGTSHDINDINYCGPAAFSESETSAVRNLALAQNFSISLSYHTYGDVIYYPWNNDIDTVSPRSGLLEAIAEDLGDRTGYAPMQGVAAYPTTGDSDDWLYSDTGCLPFTIEMGTQFVTPADQLEALCERNLGAAMLAIELAGEPEKALLPEWTIMTYMSADADQGLADQALVDINEMEVVGSTPDMNLVVLYDGMVFGDSMILHIQRDAGGFNSNIISPVVDDGGAITDPGVRELDMSDPALLRQFTSWAMGNYSAQRYMLVLWGHGDGVLNGFIPDKGVPMMVGDIRGALDGFDLDIVGFDTCSMGHFEVAAELVGIADIMIGSEAKEPLSGWNYRASLEKLAAEPGMGSDELATLIVNDYLASVTQTYATQSAIDLHVFEDDFLPLLDEFARVSADFAYGDHGRIWQARNITDTFVVEQNAVDLFEFLRNLEALNISAHAASRLGRMLGLEDRLVIASGTGTAHPDARAMAVYFPELAYGIPSYYSGLAFAGLGWGDYLSCARDPVDRPRIRSTTPGWVNSTSGINITAEIADGPASGLSLLACFRVGEGAWQNSHMTQSGEGFYTSIPGAANGSVVEYYLHETAFGISEPYEALWGADDYLTVAVNATCDLALTGLTVLNWGDIWEGNVTTLRVNCTNLGAEPADATVSITVVSLSRNVIVWADSSNATVQPGDTICLFFNWTAVPGNWTVYATAGQSGVTDTNESNQMGMVTFEIADTGFRGSTFFEDYWALLTALALIWTVSIVAMLHILRKGRRRRRDGVARSIKSARDFINTAEEFGADAFEARIMLAKAEAALAGSRFAEAEFNVSGARESAMRKVGTDPGPGSRNTGVGKG